MKVHNSKLQAILQNTKFLKFIKSEDRTYNTVDEALEYIEKGIEFQFFSKDEAANFLYKFDKHLTVALEQLALNCCDLNEVNINKMAHLSYSKLADDEIEDVLPQIKMLFGEIESEFVINKLLSVADRLQEVGGDDFDNEINELYNLIYLFRNRE